MGDERTTTCVCTLMRLSDLTVAVNDLEVRHPPTAVSPISSHQPKPFGFKFGCVVANLRIRTPIGCRRKDDTVSVNVGSHQKDRSANGVDRDQIAF